MTSRDIHSGLTNNQSFKPHDVPLLAKNNGERYHDHDDNLERGDAELIQNSSRRSSFDLIEPSFEQTSLQPRSAWTARLRGYISSLAQSIRRRKATTDNSRKKRSRASRIILQFVKIMLMTLGVLQFTSLSFLAYAAIFPDQAAYISDHWGDPTKFISQHLLHLPTGFSQDIIPIPCASHNDYWRKVPLYSALSAGCTSVEADIFLVNNDLYVGHSRSSLTRNRTLQALYINPLLDILAKQNPTTEFQPTPPSPSNGVFDTDHSQTLVLLIDFKTNGALTFPHVYSQLSPLRDRDYLSFYNGSAFNERPITIVATGNAPFNLIASPNTSSHRDIFFDAPLDLMAPQYAPTADPGSGAGQGASGNPPTERSGYNISNSYFASTSFANTIGSGWSAPSGEQVEKMRAQVLGAHEQGLKARYWDTPGWPRGLRNRVWNVLVEEGGVDYLNVDDLEAASAGVWGEW